MEEPVVVKIYVKVDPFNLSNRPTEIKVYEGNTEDSLLLRKFEAQNGPVEVYVYVNKKYSVTATYYDNGFIYTAIDSATPRLQFESERCDNPCYYVVENVVDLRIRYTK
jgi:hypothetical protein